MSSEVVNLIELEPGLPRYFKTYTMPTKSWDLPRHLSRATVYYMAENTADEGVKHTASSITTAKATFTAKKLAIRQLFSDEMGMDSVVPVYDWIVSMVPSDFNRAIEEVTINGDTSSTHMDTDVTDPKDRRKAWTGYVILQQQDSDSTQVNDYATAVKILTMKDSMGVHGMASQCCLIIPVTVANYLFIIEDKSSSGTRLGVTSSQGGPNFTIWNGFTSDKL